MLSERVRILKKNQRDVKSSMGVERARLVTEAMSMCLTETTVLKKAYMVRHLMRNMTIYIQEGELIVGNHAERPRCAPIFPEYSSEWIVEAIDEFETRPCDPLVVFKEERDEIVSILSKWKGRSFDAVSRGSLSEIARNAEESGVMTIGNAAGGTGHINPDYRNLLKNGLNHYKKICQRKIEESMGSWSIEVQRKVDFWNAEIMIIDALGDYAQRYSKLAADLAAKETDEVRKRELLEIGENCKNVPLNPPRTFMEAVQFVWFIHLAMNIETNGHGNSFNRFDQYMNDFYVRDSEAGRIDEDSAVEILQCFFIKTNDIIVVRDRFYAESFAGTPMWQNLMIGGQTADGKDAANETSFLVLKANEGVRTSQPTVSVRHFDGLSEELIEEGLMMIQEGMGTPAFFNDKLVVPMMMEKWGASLEEARDWSIVACVQTSLPGYSDGASTAGYVNPLKALELVLHNGADPVTGEQLGIKTGDIKTIDSLERLMNALYAQIDYFIDHVVKNYNIVGALHATRAPELFQSLVTNDCIDKGMSVQEGGCRYNGTAVAITGIGSATDAIAAIDTLVFKEKVLTIEAVMDALHANFEGKEDVRQTLLNKAPKYGNDIDYVDDIAADILKHYQDAVADCKDVRGGNFCAVVESQSMNVSQGKCVMASADGRFAFAPINDNASPVMGRDTHGPTATLNSVSKLNQRNAKNGCLYNLRFEPSCIKGKKGREILDSTVKAYFKNMGEHIQINVINDETLLAAQRDPESHRDLLVRVAGYLGYFTDLDKAVQNNIISRTAHKV